MEISREGIRQLIREAIAQVDDWGDITIVWDSSSVYPGMELGEVDGEVSVYKNVKPGSWTFAFMGDEIAHDEEIYLHQVPRILESLGVPTSPYPDANHLWELAETEGTSEPELEELYGDMGYRKTISLCRRSGQWEAEVATSD